MDEIGIDDSSRYPPNIFIHEDDPSRQYQADFDISYYVIHHGHSLTKQTQEKHVLELIALNELDIPHTEDAKGNNTKVSVSIFESLVPNVHQSHISNQATLNSHPVPQVFKNIKDEHGITAKNKTRLVAQGYSQEEGIDYDETFAPVLRMEAIRIFLAFATYMSFIVFQMDVKSAFVNGKLKEKSMLNNLLALKAISSLTMSASLIKPFIE
uniref:Copia protein n=1 Tax=Tanacetum cinerariifolium TaxID=118510 RepID=A0A699KT24_TANCI|nr:copia protein [Tanacetum cinerariifolium]